MRRVEVATKLACSAAKAWAEVQASALLQHVAFPMARILPADAPAFPRFWREGVTYRCNCLLFGFIPTGVRSLYFEKIDHASCQIWTREHDPLVKRWDHCISIAPAGPDQAIYTDVIEIDAGGLSFAVWLWASAFYRYRQARWRRLAKKL